MSYAEYLLDSISESLRNSPYLHYSNFNLLCNILINLNPTDRSNTVHKPRKLYSIHESVFNQKNEKRIIEMALILQRENLDTGCFSYMSSLKKDLYKLYIYISTYSNDKKIQTVVQINENHKVELRSMFYIEAEAILYCCQKADCLSLETWLRLYNFFGRLSIPYFIPVRTPIQTAIIDNEVKIDYKAEAFIFDIIDNIIKSQNAPFINEPDLITIYVNIIEILSKKRVTRKRVDRSHLFRKNISFQKEKLLITNNGVRERNYYERDDYNYDGSLGDNNFRETGRFVSHPSFDSMDDNSMP